MVSLTLLWLAWLATAHPFCVHDYARAYDDPSLLHYAEACMRDEDAKYDRDGWKMPPGPPPGGAFSIGGSVRWSHHCGNTFSITQPDGAGRPVTIVYRDRPCAEEGTR